MNSNPDYRVPPMSWAKVDGTADRVREILQLATKPYFPVVDVVEKILPQVVGPDAEFSFEIGTLTEMGSAEGLTCPSGSFIRIREDVYDEACRDGARARFTLAHELGHFLLHTGHSQPLERAQPNEKLRAFESAEKQADRFAAALLMPAFHIEPTDTPLQVMERFGVSKLAAQIRIEKMLKEGLL